MLIKEIIKRLSSDKIILLTCSKLPEILKQFEIFEETDTLISDYIRILKYKNLFFVQEMTKKKEVAIRKFVSLEKAKNFVYERMKIYDQMWDGCGCKINYYD